MEFRPFRGDDLLLAALGEVSVAGEGAGIILRLTPGPAALNPGGFVHGGTLAALFDVAFYEAARAGFAAPAVTSALELKFLRAGAADAPLYITAETLRAGRSQSVFSGSAWQNDRLIAFATAQFTRVAPPSTPDQRSSDDRPDP